MKNLIRYLLISIPLFSVPTVWAYNTNIETGVGQGEWGNTERTYNIYTETRIGLTEHTYAYGRIEYNDHPVEGIDNEGYLGLGAQGDTGFGVEAAFNSDKFYSNLYYYKQFDFYEVKGSVYYSNDYPGKFSRTGIKTQAGLRINAILTTGVYYRVGNVTKDITDDSYGLYMRVSL